MEKKAKNIIISALFCLLWGGLTIMAWLNPQEEISESERRYLANLPKLEIKSLLSGKYMKDFEDYAKDQFPHRFGFRTIKSYARFYLFSQKDNNSIYIENGYAAKLEYPLNEKSVKTATDKFQYLYDKYMKDKGLKTYISIIPDKGYYLGARKGYPSMDYDLLFRMIKEDSGYAEYIDISNMLDIDDFYKTDIHWRQENLVKVAEKIGSALGISENLSLEFETIEAYSPYYGVYYGQSALPLEPDKILYLTNVTIDSCSVFSVETGGTTPVYDTDKLDGRDPYDVYLSGATALLTVNNPGAKTDKELVIFRDSFGSSLIPLLLEGYSKVTIVDIRYIASDLLERFIDFDSQDVLFLYNSSILNNATMFK